MTHRAASHSNRSVTRVNEGKVKRWENKPTGGNIQGVFLGGLGEFTADKAAGCATTKTRALPHGVYPQPHPLPSPKNLPSSPHPLPPSRDPPSAPSSAPPGGLLSVPHRLSPPGISLQPLTPLHVPRGVPSAPSSAPPGSPLTPSCSLLPPGVAESRVRPSPPPPLTHGDAGNLQVFVEKAAVVHLRLRDQAPQSRPRGRPPASGDPLRPPPPAQPGRRHPRGRSASPAPPSPSPSLPRPGDPPGAGPGAHLLLGGVAHLAEPAGSGVPLQRRPGDAVMDVVGARHSLHLPGWHRSARTATAIPHRSPRPSSPVEPPPPYRVAEPHRAGSRHCGADGAAAETLWPEVGGAGAIFNEGAAAPSCPAAGYRGSRGHGACARPAPC